MGKEWTTQEGQVTYLINMMRRPGYLPALAHLSGCALRFYLCHLYQTFGKIHCSTYLDLPILWVKYTTITSNVQPSFLGVDSSSKTSRWGLTRAEMSRPSPSSRETSCSRILRYPASAQNH